MDFKESDCYKAALLICSSGSAILTELLRLSNYIPDAFLFLASVNKKTNKVEYKTANGKLLNDHDVLLRYGS